VIFSEALTTREMFDRFSAEVKAPLLANMTEFGKTPSMTAKELEAYGYSIVIWPVSSLRVANKAQEELYAAIKRDGSATARIPHMQTREELYRTIGYHEYEALDANVVASVAPTEAFA
jgi:methylisocitrate lyase